MVAASVTNHGVKRNYRLWQEGVQKVIQALPEEEPAGVDVGSHLRKIKEEEVNVWWR